MVAITFPTHTRVLHNLTLCTSKIPSSILLLSMAKIIKTQATFNKNHKQSTLYTILAIKTRATLFRTTQSQTIMLAMEVQ